MTNQDPITAAFKKGNTAGFKKGNNLGYKFSSDHQPTPKQKEKAGKSKTAKSVKKNKAMARRAAKVVGKTIDIENVAQETMAEADYNPVLKTIRLAKYWKNILKLHYARVKTGEDSDGNEIKALIPQKVTHKHAHLTNYVTNLINLLPYYSEKAAKKTVKTTLKREVKEIPVISPEDLVDAAEKFDDLFG